MANLNLEKAIISVLVYHDLLDYPLTALEIFKYLDKSFLKDHPSLFEVQTCLEKSPWLKNILEQKKGFYFIQGREKLAAKRISRRKIADKKWKKIQ